ncbi:hypothetical protein GCM10020221_11430 [Streptomyces thioluteus]|uniref:PD-(D/E)XK endonuclease-like domain-containing protein n=1 Tax=Streptomyces thioluteus TaxID=66431 RepID=A0ABN3WJX9_STRTU
MRTSTAAPRSRSHSQLYGSYAKCGEAYRLERVENRVSAPAGWFIQGTTVHSAIELYELSGRTISTAQAVAHYHQTWDVEAAEARKIEPDITKWRTGGYKKAEKDLIDRRALGEHQVIDYIAYTKDAGAAETIWITPDSRPAIELEFAVKVGDVPVRGFIDQVLVTPYGLSIRDIKTGTKKQSSALQLALYRRALWEMYQVNATWGDYFQCARLGRSPKAGSPGEPIDLTLIDQHWLEQQYAAMDAAERHGIYLANPGDHCAACGVAQFCKAKGAK